MTTRTLLGVTALAMLAGCMKAGPEYTPPQIEVAPTFANGIGDAPPTPSDAPLENISVDAWWERFDDPVLNDLIAAALKENTDIATAMQRIKVAEAQRRKTGYGSSLAGAATAQGQAAGAGANTKVTTSHSFDFGASYALDLFGAARRTAEKADAQFSAAEYDAGAVRLGTVSELVAAYIDLRYYQEALELTRRNIASRKKTLEQVGILKEVGAVSDLDVAQAQAQLDSAKAAYPPLGAAFDDYVFAISTLTAIPAEELLKRLQKGAPQPVGVEDFASGVPANLLRNRPDILAAERRLAAAVAQIGVAEAQLYPSLTLQGAVLEADTTSWSFGPKLRLPILNRGALKADQDAATAEAEIARLEWEAAVRKAVQEVQAAQGRLLRTRREVTALEAAKASNERVLWISRELLRMGDLSTLDMLEAEQNADYARMNLAAAVRDEAQVWASLMAATGRGWRAPE
ncbi:efflux transporter outer membrane subunit [Roseivivax sp. CAU 1761]